MPVLLMAEDLFSSENLATLKQTHSMQFCHH